jgi:hypothetical protein
MEARGQSPQAPSSQASQGTPPQLERQLPPTTMAAAPQMPPSTTAHQQHPHPQQQQAAAGMQALPPMSHAGMIPPGMHPSMMAAINMMGMQHSMAQQSQQAAMGLHQPGNGAKNGEADESEGEYTDEEYTDDEGDDE